MCRKQYRTSECKTCACKLNERTLKPVRVQQLRQTRTASSRDRSAQTAANPLTSNGRQVNARLRGNYQLQARVSKVRVGSRPAAKTPKLGAWGYALGRISTHCIAACNVCCLRQAFAIRGRETSRKGDPYPVYLNYIYHRLFSSSTEL